METYTAQADEFRKQAQEETQVPDYFPPFSSCYGILLDQQNLIFQAEVMESKARTIRSRFQEIANSKPLIPASTLLRKAVVSVRNGKIGFSVEQLEEVVAFMLKTYPYILFKPKAKSKDYVVVLFWATTNDDSNCLIQTEAQIIEKEIAVDQFKLRFAVENVTAPKQQFFYLMNNLTCVKVQNDETHCPPPEVYNQLQTFIEMLQKGSRKRKADSEEKKTLTL